MNTEERAEKARELFRQGYNCCQSVVLAYQDLTGLDISTLANLSAGFGGGMGRMRQVCGCVSGMVMLSGMLSKADNPSNLQERKDNYALVQKLASEFKSETGSIICGELLQNAGVSASGTPAPSERTDAYYKKRPCVEMVALAASIISKEVDK